MKMKTQPNERVGAFLSADKDTVKFLGFGVYEGEFVPEEAVGVFAEALREHGVTNPRIKLDNGDVVYGCECWWDGEPEVQKRLAKWKEIGCKIVTVSIDDIRAEYVRTETDSLL